MISITEGNFQLIKCKEFTLKIKMGGKKRVCVPFLFVPLFFFLWIKWNVQSLKVQFNHHLWKAKFNKLKLLLLSSRRTWIYFRTKDKCVDHCLIFYVIAKRLLIKLAGPLRPLGKKSNEGKVVTAYYKLSTKQIRFRNHTNRICEEIFGWFE